MRATSMPASTRARIRSGVFTAGPRVQTILALRTSAGYRATGESPGPVTGSFRDVIKPHRAPSHDEWSLGRRDGRRQRGRPGQVGVHRGSGSPPFGDRPHDQGLPPTGVAGHEHTVLAGHVGTVATHV